MYHPGLEKTCNPSNEVFLGGLQFPAFEARTQEGGHFRSGAGDFIETAS